MGVFVFAFALVLVHLNTITSQPGSGFSGLAVGFTVLAGVLAFGDLATGLFNPALPLGLYLAKVRSDLPSPAASSASPSAPSSHVALPRRAVSSLTCPRPMPSQCSPATSSPISTI